MVPIFPLYLVVLLMNPWRPKFSLSFVWNVCTNSRKNMKSTSLQVQITLIKVVAFLFLRKQSEKREDMLHTSITSGHASSIRVIKLRSYICIWFLSVQVKVQNDFSDEFYTSSWSYAKDEVKRETTTGTTTGYKNYDFHQTEEKNRVCWICMMKCLL